MPKGLEIVVTAHPKGVFLEGIIFGTPKPGVKMQIKADVLPVGGRHTWQVYTPTADNDPRLLAILNIDHFQGKGPNDAYVSGTRGFMYCPLPGEEMNVLVAGQAGTGSANVFDIGDRLSPDSGTGQYLAELTSANRADFVVMENIDEVPNEATLIWSITQ